MTKLFFTILIALTAIRFADDIQKACYQVEGMTCAACSVTLKAAVKRLKGIVSVEASPKDKVAVVEFRSGITDVEAIKKQIDGVGYRASRRNCSKPWGAA